tara:strand:+ start:24395 stop:25198 length:804 start_codon:yes stop_codon:yes gene_type:complete
MAMRDLMVGNVDFFLTSQIIASSPENSENTPGLEIIGMIEITEYYVPAVRPDTQQDFGNAELLEAINSALKEIFSSNSDSDVYMTWFMGEPEMDMSLVSQTHQWPTPTEGGLLYQMIHDEQELVACMYDQESPMSWLDASAVMRGFEADIFEMVTTRISSHYSAEISFRAWDSGGEFEAVQDLKRGDCDFLVGSMSAQNAVSKGLRGGQAYYVDGIVLMASEYSPELDDVNDIFGEDTNPIVDDFDRRWILISLLAIFIIYQSLRRD